MAAIYCCVGVPSFFITTTICSMFDLLVKRGIPVATSTRRQPKDHMSHADVYFLLPKII